MKKGTKNEKLHRVELKSLCKLWAAIGTVSMSGLAIYIVFRTSTLRVDGFYKAFSRGILRIIAVVTGVLPFSVAEIGLYIITLTFLIALLRLIYVMVTGKRKLMYLARFVSVIILIAASFGTAFYALWGMNYHASPLAAELEISVHPRSSEELSSLCEYLVEKANSLSHLVPRDAKGKLVDIDFKETARAVAGQFGRFTGKTETPAKPVLASAFMSQGRITGIFIPFTAEANVNVDNPTPDNVFCMAHEMAHRYGVAPEDEANFMAFLTMHDAEDPLLSYCAYLGALKYSQNRLYSADYEEFARIYALYDDNIAKDFAFQREYWSQFEGKAAKISTQVNNAFLIVQGQSDGVQSYGRMVDLMLGWYEKQDK